MREHGVTSESTKYVLVIDLSVLRAIRRSRSFDFL